MQKSRYITTIFNLNLRISNLITHIQWLSKPLWVISQFSLLHNQSINVGNKWQGAPFASMIRRSQLQNSLLNEDMLHCFCILHSSSSNVKEVKRLSLLLQVTLNLLFLGLRFKRACLTNENVKILGALPENFAS